MRIASGSLSIMYCCWSPVSDSHQVRTCSAGASCGSGGGTSFCASTASETESAPPSSIFPAAIARRPSAARVSISRPLRTTSATVCSIWRLIPSRISFSSGVRDTPNRRSLTTPVSPIRNWLPDAYISRLVTSASRKVSADSTCSAVLRAAWASAAASVTESRKSMKWRDAIVSPRELTHDCH